MTSSDAPRPPGGPLRDDAPEGDLAPDEQREELPSGEPEHGSGAGSADAALPPITGEPTQDDEDAALQEENAGTSLDQPSQ